MNLLENMAAGFMLLSNWGALGAILAGTLAGTLVGLLPGLSSTLGVALLIPFTFGMPPAMAFGLLGGMYCSSIYGGSITGILLNTPGTPAAAATVLDGYPMAQKGQAGKALGTATISSFVGGIFGTIVLMFIAPPLADFSLKFGPPETFLISVLGLTIIVSVAGKSMLKGIIAALFGLLLSTVGMDLFVGYPRFAFNQVNLYDGVSLVAAIVGFFSIPEALVFSKKVGVAEKINKITGKISLSFKEVISLIPTFIRSSFIGTFIGILPGIGTPVACFFSYNIAKRFSKHPENFGTGCIEGVAAAETANNAVEGGSFVPLLTLGIPGSGQTAIYLGAMMIQGLTPGASLFANQGDIVYSIIFGLIIANILMLIIGLSAIRILVKILQVPKYVLAPVIISFAIIGSYAINNSVFDVGLMFVLGIIGYIMRLNDFPIAPVVLALILGPIGEKAFIQTLQIYSGNSVSVILTRPISVVIITTA